jgi:SAM-dependent methyltransferase
VFPDVSEDERERWDQRYASGEYRPRSWPTALLEQWIPTLGSGKALVIACGTGRNALYLAKHGFDVTGVDISEVAIERASREAESHGLAARFVVADLDDFSPEGSFDLVTVIRYRNRELWPRLVNALAPGGWILAEHHMKTTADVAGPSSPEFRLDPGELLREFGGLRIVHYSESIEQADDETARYAIQRAVACNGAPGW